MLSDSFRAGGATCFARAQPFSEASVSALLASLSVVTARHDELQLDYDAPDRLLGVMDRRSNGFIPWFRANDHGFAALEPTRFSEAVGAECR